MPSRKKKTTTRAAAPETVEAVESAEGAEEAVEVETSEFIFDHQAKDRGIVTGVKQWPLAVKLPSGEIYVLEKEDALICICSARHTTVTGVDLRRYKVPKGALCSKELFTLWDKMSPMTFIPFTGDPKALEGPITVIVPRFSMRGYA